MLTSMLVDALRAAIFAAAHVLGSVGAGVLAVSLLLRLALLPLTLRLARRSLAQRRLLARIQPELTALNERFKKEPEQLWRATLTVYRRHGYKPVDVAGFAGGLAQVPVFAGIYAAVRSGLGAMGSLGWIANLARPDGALALLVALTTGVASYIGVQTGATSPRTDWTVAAVGTTVSLVLFWKASSVLVLSWGASSAVNLVQGVLLRRERRQSVQP
jgi:YidC/Oxa1 family membrane protein insertase